MSKKWVILGGGGSFGIHTAFWLLRNADPVKVIGIGRNPLHRGAFSLASKGKGLRISRPSRHL